MLDNCPKGFFPMAYLESALTHAWADGARPEWLVQADPPLSQDGGIVNGEALQRALLSYLGPLLASGKMRAAGIDQNSGEIVWVPPETWRILPNYSMSGSRPKTVLQSALEGAEIGMVGRRRLCLPLLTAPDFLSISGLPDTPTQASVEPLDITHPPASPRPPPIAEPPRRNPGGRQSRHDWDAFWIEVAWYAAQNDLEEKHRAELQQYMEDWTARTSPDPPDAATIRKKLAALYARATAPN